MAFCPRQYSKYQRIKRFPPLNKLVSNLRKMLITLNMSWTTARTRVYFILHCHVRRSDQ